MAASEATLGVGCLVKSGDGAGSEVFANIGEVQSFSHTRSAQIVEVTHMESPNLVREYKSGLIDPGQFNINMNYLPDGTKQTALQTDLAANTKRNFKVTFTDATPATWSFAALVQSFGINADKESQLQASAVLQLTGALPTQS